MDCSFVFCHIQKKEQLHTLPPDNAMNPNRVLPCFTTPKKRGWVVFSGFRIHTVQIGFKFDLSGFCVLSVCLPVYRLKMLQRKAAGVWCVDFIQFASDISATLQINSLIMIGTKIMENSGKKRPP